MPGTSHKERAARLRALLRSREATVFMEAHNGLVARIAQEAGFEALWASGLAISASLGVRDSNEASWTQVVEVAEFIADATDLPVLLDGDTGYGNFNNVRRLVRKLGQRGIAGVCLEDKCFPKANSFLPGAPQPLCDVDEFCGKLRAARDEAGDDGTVVVARTEAFIAGRGLEEALVRATAYARNGADAVLIHSKRPDAREIEAFCARWTEPTPLVVVPTTYPTTPVGQLVAWGACNVIFANHALRATVATLQRTLGDLRRDLDLAAVEGAIAPVAEIFRLQDVGELKRSEDRYLPPADPTPRAVILAAGSDNFGAVEAERPKCMIRLRGRPILAWQAEVLRGEGVTEVAVVRGYRKAAVDLPDVLCFDNDDYETTGELRSLLAAREFLRGPLLIAYGDILYDRHILRAVLDGPGAVTVAADAAFRVRGRADHARDLVRTEPPRIDGACPLVDVGVHVAATDASGEWIGLVATTAQGTEALLRVLDDWAASDPKSLRRAGMPELLARLPGAGVEVAVAHVYGHWRDVDDPADLRADDRAG